MGDILSVLREGEPGPLFILGAHRSGTTQMLRLCKEALNYPGATEGHVWQSLKVLDDHYARIVAELPAERAPALRDFSVTLFTGRELVRRYAAALLDLHRTAFGDTRFVDKSPGVESVAAAPLLREILPAAQFIFMKRRGIENVMSHLRRFPDVPFRTACLAWARPMQRWLEVRDRLAPRFLEIDQRDLGVNPAMVAGRLTLFLERDDPKPVTDYLATHFPEKTKAGGYAGYLALKNTGWNEADRDCFREICGPVMIAFGYQIDWGDVPASAGWSVDLTSPAYLPRWTVVHRNKWVSTDPPGLRLHANDPGTPPPTLTLRGCLESGRYRFEAEILVFDARCPPQRITIWTRGRFASQSFSFDLKGGSPGPVTWSVPSIELAEICDVEIAVALDAAATSASYSAIQLVSATFTAQTSGSTEAGTLQQPST